MILDERTEFCDATALNTGGAGSYLVGDQIDLTLARDIGRGEPIYFVVTIDTALVGVNNTTSFSLCSDSTASIAVDGSQTVHYTSPVFAVTALATAGVVPVCVALPWEGIVYERYLGVVHTTAVAALSAGKINAFLTHDPARWKAYADASN
jgi:hypothetical protein